MMQRFIIPVVIVAVLAILSAIVSGVSPTEVQGNSPPAANVQVVNGPTPGYVIVRRDTVSEATHYRIGYVDLVRDYPQAKASVTGNWREAFVNGFAGDRGGRRVAEVQRKGYGAEEGSGDSVTPQAPATDCSADDYDRDEWGEYPGADADAVPTWTLPSDDVASGEITLDHHVALKDAHVSGGCDWIVAMKNDFATDPANLNSTTRSFNSSKGSRTPDQLTGIAQRIIDTEDEQCDYATQHDEVKDKYDLSMTESERETVTQWLALCQGEDSGDSVTPQTPATNPGVATGVSVGPLNSGGTLQVNWTKAANATGYIVIAVNTANVADVGATPVNGGDIETANISGLTFGATYDIYVVATAKGGFAFPDAAVPATAALASTPDVTPMPGPTLPLPTPTPSTSQPQVPSDATLLIIPAPPTVDCYVGLRLSPGQGCIWPEPELNPQDPSDFAAYQTVSQGGDYHGQFISTWRSGNIWIEEADSDAVRFTTSRGRGGSRFVYRFWADREANDVWVVTKVNELVE